MTSRKPVAALSPDAVAAICRHLNDDHADDCVVLCRVQGDVIGATAARAVSVDPRGLDLEATVGDATRSVRIPFRDEITERRQVREQLVRLVEDARAHDPAARRGEP